MALQGSIGPEHGVGVRFGVEFATTRTSLTVGRRIAIREFAGRDEPSTADLGRKARRYRVEAVLLGEEYLNQYNDLINELETPGRKRLRHPTLGDQIVRVPEQELAVSMTTRGRVDVSFDVVEAGPRETVLIVALDWTTPIAAARAARDKNARDRMNLLNRISEFADKLLSKVREGNTALRGAQHAINSRLVVVDDLAHQIDLLDDNIHTLLATPDVIANSFGNLVKQLFDLATTVTDLLVSPPLAVMDAAEELVAFGDDDADARLNESQTVVTPEREEYGTSMQAIFDMVRASAVIEVAAVLPELSFESGGQVRQVRSRLSDMLDHTLGSPTMGTELSSALGEMWGALDGFLTGQAQTLPNVVTWQVPKTMPAIVVAQMLYGDPSRAEEIVDRNRAIIANPSFVPGGVALEVLSV